MVILKILSYIGPPDYLAVYQRSAFISKEIKYKEEAAGVTLEEAPIEKPGPNSPILG